MVETVEVRDSRTGETVECFLVKDAAEFSGKSRRTLERLAAKGELTRFRYLGRSLHPVGEIKQLIGPQGGVRPGGAKPNPKPRPNPAPPKDGA